MHACTKDVCNEKVLPRQRNQPRYSRKQQRTPRTNNSSLRQVRLAAGQCPFSNRQRHWVYQRKEVVIVPGSEFPTVKKRGKRPRRHHERTRRDQYSPRHHTVCRIRRFQRIQRRLSQSLTPYPYLNPSVPPHLPSFPITPYTTHQMPIFHSLSLFKSKKSRPTLFTQGGFPSVVLRVLCLIVS